MQEINPLSPSIENLCELDKKRLCSSIYRMAERFFEDPENEKLFEEAKRQEAAQE